MPCRVSQSLLSLYRPQHVTYFTLVSQCLKIKQVRPTQARDKQYENILPPRCITAKAIATWNTLQHESSTLVHDVGK